MDAPFQLLLTLNVLDEKFIVRTFTPYYYREYCIECYEEVHGIEYDPDYLFIFDLSLSDPKYLQLWAKVPELKGKSIEDIKKLILDLRSKAKKLPHFTDEELDDIRGTFGAEPFPQPGYFNEEWLKVKERLLPLTGRKQINYISQILAALQRKYEALVVQWNIDNSRNRKVCCKSLVNCLETYANFMYSIVQRTFADFKLYFSDTFIFEQFDMYNQLIELGYKDPLSVYPGLKNVMERHKCLLLGNLAKKQDENKRFSPAFSEDKMRIIYNRLINNNLIDDLPEEHFLYWFGVSDNLPQNLKPINWLKTQSLLAYFILQYNRAVKKNTQYWNIAANVFLCKGKPLNTDSMTVAMSRLESGTGKKSLPQNAETIDFILSQK